MTSDQKIQLLTFSGGLVLILQTLILALPSLDDTSKVIIGALSTAVVAIIDLALGVFFKVRKPIGTALMTPPPVEK